MIPFLHPLIAAATIAAAIWVATLGFRGRRRRDPRDLGAHARFAPWVFAAMLASWVGGLVTVIGARADLEATTSTHFLAGSAITALFALSALSSRWLDAPLVRAVHPWIGALGLLLCGVQAMLGLELLP
ncbi:MAG: DUF4079 family protein [Candidatus Binatia bacterium]